MLFRTVFRTSIIIEKYRVVASFTQDLHHLDRSENVLFQAITKLGQVLQHFSSGAVVPVVPSLAIFLRVLRRARNRDACAMM